jgi:hypothetical protein
MDSEAEFWILTNKCGNKLTHEIEAEGSCNSFYACVDEGCNLLLCP